MMMARVRRGGSGRVVVLMVSFFLFFFVFLFLLHRGVACEKLFYAKAFICRDGSDMGIANIGFSFFPPSPFFLFMVKAFAKFAHIKKNKKPVLARPKSANQPSNKH